MGQLIYQICFYRMNPPEPSGSLVTTFELFQKWEQKVTVRPPFTTTVHVCGTTSQRTWGRWTMLILLTATLRPSFSGWLLAEFNYLLVLILLKPGFIYSLTTHLFTLIIMFYLVLLYSRFTYLYYWFHSSFRLLTSFSISSVLVLVFYYFILFYWL